MHSGFWKADWFLGVVVAAPFALRVKSKMAIAEELRVVVQTLPRAMAQPMFRTANKPPIRGARATARATGLVRYLERALAQSVFRATGATAQAAVSRRATST